MTREKTIDTKLEAFRQETGMDPEAYVAGWRDGSIDQSDENRGRYQEAERLWEHVKNLRPGG
jgi:hypothetical protein